MLQFMRTHASSWIIKGILGLIVLSFVIWGVGDLVRGRGTQNTVATVGRISISEQYLQRLLQAEIRQYNSQFPQSQISLADAVSMGLAQKVLDELVAKFLILEETDRLSLMVPQYNAMSLIRHDPMFQDKSGNFDKEKFIQILKANRLSEKDFLSDRAQVLKKNQLIKALTLGVFVPDRLALNLYAKIHEEREFDILYVPFTAFASTPSEKDIEGFYASHKDAFLVPEQRDITALAIDAKEIGKRFSFSEKQLKEGYERFISEFTQEEKRDVIVYKFDKHGEAEKAHDLLQKNKEVSFGDVSELSDIERAELPEDMGTPIFSAPVNNPTRPIKLGAHHFIFHVKKIYPRQKKAFASVRSSVEEKLRTEKGVEEMAKISALVEELLSKGKSLEAIAKDHHIPLIVRTNVTREKDASLPSEVLQVVFDLDEGFESSLIEAKTTGYVVRVDKISSAHIPTLDHIKNKVISACSDQKAQKATAHYCNKQATNNIKSLNEIKALPKQYKRFVSPLISQIDAQKDEKISREFLKKGFSSPVNTVFMAPYDKGYCLAIARKKTSIDMSKNPSNYRRFKRSLRESINQDFLYSYLQALKALHKTKISSESLEKLAS